MKNIKPGGFVFLAVIAALIAGGKWYFSQHPNPEASRPAQPEPGEAATITAFVGGEKMLFIQNDQVIGLLKERYNLTVNATKAGSMEMVATANPGVDCLWPSNQVAAEVFQANGGKALAKENIFSSPLVFYAWDEVADALVKSGYAAKRPDSYQIDFGKLSTALREGKSWGDIGLGQLYGKVKVYTTDPTVSNSGNMFAGLLATVWNGGEVPDETSVNALLPDIKRYFQRMGSMERSSSDLFDNFLKQGAGARPIIVSYENQLVEFSLMHEESQQLLRDRIRTMYPQPTVWSEHPVIAITPKCKRLIAALKDPDIQKLAWEKHGFRSGLIGVQNDPKILNVTGIPAQVTAVIPMPGAPVMEKIIQTLQQ